MSDLEEFRVKLAEIYLNQIISASREILAFLSESKHRLDIKPCELYRGAYDILDNNGKVVACFFPEGRETNIRKICLDLSKSLYYVQEYQIFADSTLPDFSLRSLIEYCNTLGEGESKEEEKIANLEREKSILYLRIEYLDTKIEELKRGINNEKSSYNFAGKTKEAEECLHQSN